MELRHFRLIVFTALILIQHIAICQHGVLLGNLNSQASLPAYSDDFSNSALSPFWTFENSSFGSMSSGGVYGSDACLVCTLTSNAEYYAGYAFNGPLLLQTISNSETSWTATIKLETVVSSNNWDIVSIIIRNGNDYPSLLFGMAYYGGSYYPIVLYNATSSSANDYNIGTVPSTTLYYQLQRSGNTLSARYSSNGLSWTTFSTTAGLTSYMSATSNSITEIGISFQYKSGITNRIDWFEISFDDISDTVNDNQ